MLKIRWNDLPSALRDHLFDRLRERKIICGEGEYPRTFLLRGQPAKGQKLY